MPPKKNKKKAVADDDDLDFLDSVIAETQTKETNVTATENEKAGVDDAGDDAGDGDNEDNEEEGDTRK
jgi:hypothetical protein